MISIITPVLNGAQFIEGCLSSVASLTVAHEHIVVDGGSHDGTIDIVRNAPCTLIRQHKKDGMYGAINQGIRAAGGTLLAYINCDDRLLTSGFTRLFEAAITHQTGVTYGDALFEYSKNRKRQLRVGVPFGSFFLRFGIMPFVQPACIFSREAYDAVGGFRAETFKIIGDMEFFRRIAMNTTFPFRYVSACASIFLKHGESLGDREQQRFRAETALVGARSSVWIRATFSLLLRLLNVYGHHRARSNLKGQE